MDAALKILLDYGVLGIMVIVLLIAIKAVYTRNGVLNDKFHEIVVNNSTAMNNHAKAIEGFNSTMGEFKEVIRKCAK